MGLIVSAKPEDRRLFIEEAAGITRYRKRKEAAERRMEATRQNLTRVNDILGEINSRLGSLRRQAKKAERYKLYADEMRDIELWQATHKLLGLIVSQRTVAEKNERLAGQHEDLERTLVQAEASLSAKRLEAADVEHQISQLQEQHYQLENRIQLGESEIESPATRHRTARTTLRRGTRRAFAVRRANSRLSGPARNGDSNRKRGRAR